MREIKFRAWDVRNEVMWSQKPKQLTSEFYKLIEQDIQGGEQFTLMQYTGLKDQNGVEIYEGDIVTAYPKITRDNAFKREVVWHGDGYYLKEVADTKSITIQLSKANLVMEVIGNIYENPELLEAKE